MQNYLQSKKSKLPIIVVVFVLLILATLSMNLAENKEKHGEKLLNTKYTRLSGPNYELMTEENETPIPDENPKMNNFSHEVAKMYTLDTQKEVLTDVRADYVNVLMPDGKVKSMELEEYVRGCVYGEMPLSFEPQALMAQSVAARTFAVNMMNGTSKHKNADVCTSPACCQNYIVPTEEAIGSENFRKLCGCTLATEGIVLTYCGKPIEAVYHASSGQSTLNSEDVWGGYLEYLRAVESPEGETAISASGMGHRVGMSQHGANLLAKEGMGYMEILKYYYSGISFDFL